MSLASSETKESFTSMYYVIVTIKISAKKKGGVKSLLFIETTYIVGYVFWDTIKSIRSVQKIVRFSAKGL